ncbi:pentapeptide repeat-containing protein [Candidatus Rickettsiella viridis]|uniref:Pentapeptide repeat-containing protein n=1 Tax=Candidatus Rickettsiella viridis TaxID=676208 RepID=A0A2Z5UWF5_9COXI|nr:hypothetical protein [Candidatus Rickettsiella viridis]BBB15240.1 pentapeptide repeat-containing protein [Candidatus Rickettsiella viridis]
MKKTPPFTSLEDIKQFAQSLGEKSFVLETLTLRIKPIFSLENTDELNIHWGYQPQDIDYTKLLKFIEQARQASTRPTLKLQSYIYQPVIDTKALQEFTQSLEFLGFREVRVDYFNSQKQALIMKIEAGLFFITSRQQIAATTLHTDLENKKSLFMPTPIPKETHQARLNRITTRVKIKLKTFFRAAGQQGAHYQIGAAIMHILHQWYINRAPEAKDINEATKADLKLLAQRIAIEVGKQRSATNRQIELAERLASQCIDRGECSNEELVISDVIDSLYQMRPDLVIGNEYLFKKTKELFIELFIEIGSFFTNQFDNIKQWFRGGNSKLQKRAIVDWSESPLLMKFVKKIESGFYMLDMELQQDDSFSDEELVGVLSNLWLNLATQVVNNTTTAESLLALLKNTTYIEQTLNLQLNTSLLNKSKSLPPPIPLPLIEKKENENSEDLSLAASTLNTTSNSERMPRQKRAIPLNNPFISDKIWDQSEAYLNKHTKQQLKPHTIHRSKPAPQFLTAKQPKPKPKQSEKQLLTLHTKQKRKHKTQNNNTSHLLKSVSIKQPTLAKLNYLPRKQTRPVNITPHSVKTSLANNVPNLFHRKEIAKHSGKYLGIEASSTKNTYSHYQNATHTSPGTSRVTASSDPISTLFFLDTAVRYWTRNPHRPMVKESAASINKGVEKQIQHIMQRKFKKP